MKVLLIIDMLNGFCRNGNPLSLPNKTLLIEKEIEKQIINYKIHGNEVLFICDSHSLVDAEINNPYPPHCLIGSEEAEIVDSLKNYSNSLNTITKNTLSITFNTDLINRMELLKPTEIEIAGVCTDICILFAVYELKIRGFNVIINSKAILSLEKENQQFFLVYMEKFLGGKIK